MLKAPARILEAGQFYGELLRKDHCAGFQENRRFIDNGKVITTAGVSAGIDGALHVVSRLLGREEALKTARYMEYKWETLQEATKNQ